VDQSCGAVETSAKETALVATHQEGRLCGGCAHNGWQVAQQHPFHLNICTDMMLMQGQMMVFTGAQSSPQLLGLI
jgi:hypothetical protein